MTLRLTQIARILIGIWMTGVVLAMFLWIPQYEGLGNAGRIMILHVPTAWVSVLAFAVSAWYSAMYLWRGQAVDDDRALAAAECGMLFTILATVTGAIFSQVVWGVYWNWDPRQTSIFVLMLIYAALFALRAAIEPKEQQRKLSAVFSLFAFVTVPFLIFVAPRMADSTLHPNCAFAPNSSCDGITLRQGSIGLLGDRKVQLLALEEQGDTVVARVQVSEPGLTSEAVLEPTFDLTQGESVVEPTFPGLRYRLVVQSVDPANGTVLLNIHAPGTGILANQRTLVTFLASLGGFTALFFWIFSIRTSLLGVAWLLEQREVAHL
ncbi:MAG: cytochrome c biogenesis protein CcsA [Chloroflexaceae bacterium]|nr:cytochrome c biogenesis protein CcsA [Chloroflexaceae bacterium]